MIISFVSRGILLLLFFSISLFLPTLDAVRGISLDEDHLVLHIAILLLFIPHSL